MNSLDDQTSLWFEKIQQALLRHENTQRKALDQPPLPEDTHVMLPDNPRALFLFLNWKVWSTRYCVSLDFILRTLLTYFQNNRKPQKEGIVSLGLNVPPLTGNTARRVIEEAVVQAFPNRENYRAAHQPNPLYPVRAWDYQSPEDFTVQYAATMEQHHRKLLTDQNGKRRHRTP